MKLSTLYTGALLLFLSSCTTAGMVKTASTLKTKADIHSLTIADLEVSPERVTHTIHPSDEILRGGEENAKRAAEAEVLAAHNNADVLVDAQYVITKDNGSLFKRPKITSITVTGHPAHYKNYHSVPASVWDNAVAAATAVGQSINPTGSGEAKKVFIPTPKFNFSGAKFEGYFNAFGGYMVPEHDDIDDGCYFAGGSLTLGCRILPQLFIGAGAAGKYVFHSEFVYVPVYGNIRFYTHNGSISPFIDAKVGHSFVPGDKMYKGGFFASPTIGYAFGRFEIGIQYTFQKCRIESYQMNRTSKEHNLALSLGLRL